MGSEWKPSILNSDMADEMQSKAVKIAKKGIESCSKERDIAAYIKKEFDKSFDGPWHCVVGRQFGSYLSHERGQMVYFHIGRHAVLLFKSG